MDTEQRNEIIEKYFKEGVSNVGIVSLLYHHGFEGVRHEELRKIVFKECQRIDSKNKASEEKKNTMGNLTKEQAIDFLREYAKCGIYHNYTEPQDKLNKMNECIALLTASGSVAAPKEEEDEWLCPTCGNKWGSDEGKYCSSSWHLATPLIQKQVARLQSELASLRQQLKEREELIANLKQDIVRLVEDVNKAYEH